MRIGVDFDNTIVCYDTLFHDLAMQRNLIPPELDASKEVIRDYLRLKDNEDAWTELQGTAYGICIESADPFPGVREFFAACTERDLPVFVVSHRTRRPYRGPDIDLHAAARNWLVKQRICDCVEAGLARMFFEETVGAKFDRIAALDCTHFVDDLPEFLESAGFPSRVERILFDPHDRHAERIGFRRATSWAQIAEIVLP